MRQLSLAFAAIAALLIALPTQAATLLVSGFTLTGATGVNVNGTLYDVSLVDGACSVVFTGCDSNLDFAFTNVTDATAAAQALLDQVFVDGLDGPFDTTPFLTNGCADPIICTAWIPYNVAGIDVSLMTATNTNGVDFLQAGIADPSADTSQSSQLVWARFTLSATTPGIPEPGSWAMMLLGFGAIGALMRYRPRKAMSTAAAQA